jgi:hypothetical protein
MKPFRFLQSHRWLALVLVAIWIIGAVSLYWQLPIEPRTILPITYSAGIGAWVNGSRYLSCGSSQRWIVLPHSTGDTFQNGPIWLWDTQTGQLIAEHLTANDKFDHLVMRDDCLRIMCAINSKPKLRRDFILNLRTGTFTPGSTQPEFGELMGIHPKRDFIVCKASVPRTGLDWVDVESGQIIRAFPDAKFFRWTTDHSHYAYQSDAGIVVCRASDHSIVSRVDNCKTAPRILSLRAGIVGDWDGHVWDLRSGEMLWHDTTISFRNSGVELTADESAIVWRKSTDPWEIVHIEARTGREMPGKSFQLPLAEIGSFGGEAGSYWIACVNQKPPVNPSAWQQFIQNIPLIGSQLANDDTFSTVIVDSNTLTELFRCPGALVSVSDDRKTVITSHRDGYAVWDVSGRSSWRAILIAMAGWTCLWLAASGLVVGIVFAVRRNSKMTA